MPNRPFLPLRSLLTAALTVLLVSCAGELSTPGEALRLLGADLPDAVVNEPYQVRLHAVGGLRPYEFALGAGALPPGLTLAGGELRGTPTTIGDYAFTLEVTDANLSSTFVEYALAVVTPPAPALDLQLPDTEVRSEVTVRARVTDARALVGLRTELTWDPERFSLRPDSVSASRQQTALIHEAEPGRLRVDLALLGSSLQGQGELFSFVLVPAQTPTTVAVGSTTEFASAGAGDFRYEFAEATAATGGAPLGAPDDVPEGLDGELDGDSDDDIDPDPPDDGEDLEPPEEPGEPEPPGTPEGRGARGQG